MSWTGKLAKGFKRIFESDISFMSEIIEKIKSEMKVKAREGETRVYAPNYYLISIPKTEVSEQRENLAEKIKLSLQKEIERSCFQLYGELQVKVDLAKDRKEGVSVLGQFRLKGLEKRSSDTGQTKEQATKVFTNSFVSQNQTKKEAPTVKMESISKSKGYLKLKQGAEDKCFRLKAVETNIGRQESNEIAILDKSVSRVHAQIIDKKCYYLIRDLESTNGVMINGEFVKECQLEDGDEIRLGEVILEFIRN